MTVLEFLVLIALLVRTEIQKFKLKRIELEGENTVYNPICRKLKLRVYGMQLRTSKKKSKYWLYLGKSVRTDVI